MSIEDRVLQNLRDQEKLREEGERLRREVEVTYSIGDRFVKDGEKYILAATKGGPILISLEKGYRWSDPKGVLGPNYNITSVSFAKITGGADFTRYWDSRKGEKV